MKTNQNPTVKSIAKKHWLCLLLLAGMSVTTMQVQAQYKASGSTVKVSGTSNVHDWKMNALNPVSEADFGPLTAGENVPKTLTALSFSVNTKSLKSDNSSMDGRTYKALNADQHPKITYKLTSAVITPVSKNKFTVKAVGGLTISGVTKTITMQVNGTVNADQSITCSGTEKIKFSDFSMKAPSFMLGAMKVGDELTISYTMNYKK